MKRVIIQTSICYLLCLSLVLLFNELFLERQGWEDIFGLTTSSFVYLLTLTVCFYLPFYRLFLNRSSANFVILFYGIVLNIPFFIFAIIMTGRAFQAIEAILFSFMYIVTGSYFGILVNKRRTSYAKK